MAVKENNENPSGQVPNKPALDADNTEKSHPGEHYSPAAKPAVPESGGRGGLDPTRFGDWEIAGKCVDF
jgi:hypothetical protein